tara:strand:+ start:493 stop:960 length:468 start_codon:yes stop_codon:yes gene_type:complete
MNIKIFYKFIIFCVISSCSTREDNEILGKMIGTAVGAVVGSKLGDGQNTRAIYSIIGAASGYLIGKEVGRLLSNREIDDLNNNIIDSLNKSEDGKTTLWESTENKNTYAEITPKDKVKLDGKDCRIYEKILYKDGETVKKESKACRDSDGNWVIL